jgi:CDP-glycerol glycerophosphotransferase
MRVVYNSFSGRYSDSPRAVYERLHDRPGLSHVWLADPAEQTAFPADVTTVPVDGPEAVEALEAADLVIANSHTEVEWTKPAGATYVQIWHGTPLKRIHHDVLWAPEGRLSWLDQDVARWDLLLSPNAVSTPRLRQAFRYDGEVLESGYPRNDLLSDPDGHVVRERVRKELGLADDVTAVLYAPTWRDDLVLSGSQATLPWALDFTQLTERLGPGYHLLPRHHVMMTGRSEAAELPGVRDVSTYPDIRHLYLAADAMVTDYSSAMFDFAITGKPLLFYTYDFERFRDTVRGFYFDLVPQAPGPMVRTTAELAEAVARLPAVATEYADRYRRFAERYCSLADGHATQRLLDHLGL